MLRASSIIKVSSYIAPLCFVRDRDLRPVINSQEVDDLRKNIFSLEVATYFHQASIVSIKQS